MKCYKFRVLFALLTLAGALLLSAAHAFAQSYKIERLSPLMGNGPETVTDATDSGYILGRFRSALTSRTECPFLFNIHTREKVNLCKVGMRRAFDVNKFGVVAGVSNTNSDLKRRAVIWDKRRGLRRIPKLNPQDTFNGAFGINDKGEVVGYSGKISQHRDPDNLGDTPYSDTRGFIWDSKNGTRAAFSTIDRNNIAIRINNRSSVLGVAQRSLEDFPVIGVPVFRRKGAAALPLHEYPGGYFYFDLTLATVASFSLSERNHVGALRYLFPPGRGKIHLPDHFSGARYDFGFETHVNSRGQATGLTNGVAWLYSKNRGSTEISCLAPQNRRVAADTDLRVKDLRITSVAGPTDRGRVIFSGDLQGDNKGERIFLLTALPQEERGLIYDFCPQLSLDVVGECDEYFTNNNGGSVEQVAALPDRKQCTAKVQISSLNGSAQEYAGLRIDITRDDDVGTNGQRCAAQPHASVLTGLAGAAVQFSFPVTGPDSYYTVSALGDNKRFRPIPGAFIYPFFLGAQDNSTACSN